MQTFMPYAGFERTAGEDRICCIAVDRVPRHMSVIQTVARAAATAGGQILRAATRGISARPAMKPLHPHGSVARGTLRRFGGQVPSTVPWLDEAGEDAVLVRRSRAMGLPSVLPDIVGLAVRVPLEAGRHGDLLLASTGLGPVTRFTLIPSWSPHGRHLTTLLPYRTPAGPVVLAAVARDDDALDFSWALRSGAWHRFAELRVHHVPVEEGDLPMSFDPVRNVLPGLEIYDWVRRLREPAYATARASRRS